MFSRSDLDAMVGRIVGRSQWVKIDQPQIDAFATITRDNQFIHTDPNRARTSPFGTTIAHGFLTLSMLSWMAHDIGLDVEDEAISVNYGFDRLRFVSPVRSGARVRGVFVLSGVTARGADAIDTAFSVTVEIEGGEKPALVAEWINRRYFGEHT